MIANAVTNTARARRSSHPLFATLEDQARAAIVAWDAFTLSTGEKKLDRATRASETIRQLGQKLEYDRGCQQMLEWTELHRLANRVWSAWMLCMLNGSTMSDTEVGDLDEAVQNAKRFLNTTLSSGS